MQQRRVTPVAALEGSIRAYPWGSHTAIAAIQGRAHPTSEPEAELWFGAHPSGPALLQQAGTGRPLDRVIAEDSLAILGPGSVERFGPQLPFLLKLLAIERPLSLQAHPSAAQAAMGSDDEDARGVPIDAPERTYRDAWPKPELLCALSEVDAFAGFRAPEQTVALLTALDVPGLGWLRERFAGQGSGALAGAVEQLLRWPAADRPHLVASVIDRARTLADAGGPHAAVADWLVRLGAFHPADPGVVVASLLNLVRLHPGEAIYLPAGNLHAYLSGTAVEVMATSDNVLRGGLTDKHVDVDGLLRVLDARALPPPRVAAVPTAGGYTYPTPAAHFRLERLVPGSEGLLLERRGPEILLAVGGPAQVRADGVGVALASGQAAFVRADALEVRVEGDGPVFRATVGNVLPSERLSSRSREPVGR